jgi:uncharacterized protein YbjT (DUF2867 family)
MMMAGQDRLVTVFGGSGFVGRHVVRALLKRGWRVRVAVRRPDLAGHLQPLGVVGQVHAVQANLRYPESVARAVKGADAVVNLVGILMESGKQSFDAVQGEGARVIAEACSHEGIGNLVHMSAIGADEGSASVYARTKAEGELAIRTAVPTAIVLRASIIFGPEDGFFNRFAGLARMLPVVPVVGAETRFQPVFVGDVAQAVAEALDGKARAGTVYELGGPEVRSFRDLVTYVCEVIGRKRLLLPLPFGAARLQAGALEFANKALFGLMPASLMLTRDQVTLLETDNVVSEAAKAEGRTLEALGIAPTAIDTIVPSYLWRFRRTGQFVAQKPL